MPFQTEVYSVTEQRHSRVDNDSDNLNSPAITIMTAIVAGPLLGGLVGSAVSAGD
jgi:hypothetical protein